MSQAEEHKSSSVASHSCTSGDSIEQNPFKEILTQLLLQLEFNSLPTDSIPLFLANSFKKHSIIVGINYQSKSLGLMLNRESEQDNKTLQEETGFQCSYHELDGGAKCRTQCDSCKENYANNQQESKTIV